MMIISAQNVTTISSLLSDPRDVCNSPVPLLQWVALPSTLKKIVLNVMIITSELPVNSKMKTLPLDAPNSQTIVT
jgi:hypothetical protein